MFFLNALFFNCLSRDLAIRTKKTNDPLGDRGLQVENHRLKLKLLKSKLLNTKVKLNAVHRG